MNPLVMAWQDAMDSFCATVDQIPDASWSQPSLLPGWTVGDIVAHVAALEVELSGQPLPAHEPDWDSLPHADDLFSRYTEIGVDHRRAWSPAQVRAELAEVARIRGEQLREGPQEDRPITGVGGLQLTFERQLRMRCFDIFLHELDVRDALDMPPPHFGEAGKATVTMMADSLGYVWAKKAGAQPGDLLHVVVDGFVDTWVEVDADGRGRVGHPGMATVRLYFSVMDFLRLGSGRSPRLAKPVIEGDQDLARAVLAGLNVAP